MFNLKHDFSSFDHVLGSKAPYNVISRQKIQFHMKCLKQTLISIKFCFKWYTRLSIFVKKFYNSIKDDHFFKKIRLCQFLPLLQPKSTKIIGSPD